MVADAVQSGPVEVPSTVASEPMVFTEAAETPDRPAVAATPPVISWRGRFEPLLPWLSAAWMLGVALLSLRHFVGWRRLCMMRRSGVNARP